MEISEISISIDNADVASMATSPILLRTRQLHALRPSRYGELQDEVSWNDKLVLELRDLMKIDVFPSHSIWNIWGGPGSQRGSVESSQASWHPRQSEKSAGPDFHPSHPSHPPAIGSNFSTISTTSHYHSLNYPLMLVKNKKPSIVWWFTIDYHPLPTWMVVVDRTKPKVVRPYCRNLEPLQMMRMGGLGWNYSVSPTVQSDWKCGGQFGAIPKGRSRPVATERFGEAATSGQQNPQLHRCAILQIQSEDSELHWLIIHGPDEEWKSGWKSGWKSL